MTHDTKFNLNAKTRSVFSSTLDAPMLFHTHLDPGTSNEADVILQLIVHMMKQLMLCRYNLRLILVHMLVLLLIFIPLLCCLLLITIVSVIAVYVGVLVAKIMSLIKQAMSLTKQAIRTVTESLNALAGTSRSVESKLAATPTKAIATKTCIACKHCGFVIGRRLRFDENNKHFFVEVFDMDNY